MDSSLILLVILGAIVLFGIVSYNRIIALRQKRLQAFSDIDVQLKLRYDLIPNLVETVKGYAAHEKELLEKVTQARADAMNTSNIGDRAKAEGMLGMAVTSLLAVAENYPDLKANQNFLELQRELTDIENKVAAARRFFNNATAEFNAQIQQFPALLIARLFNFQSETFFEVPAEERAKIEQPVAVKF